jgi:hypothetical protein
MSEKALEIIHSGFLFMGIRWCWEGSFDKWISCSIWQSECFLTVTLCLLWDRHRFFAIEANSIVTGTLRKSRENSKWSANRPTERMERMFSVAMAGILVKTEEGSDHSSHLLRNTSAIFSLNGWSQVHEERYWTTEIAVKDGWNHFITGEEFWFCVSQFPRWMW